MPFIYSRVKLKSPKEEQDILNGNIMDIIYDLR